MALFQVDSMDAFPLSANTKLLGYEGLLAYFYFNDSAWTKDETSVTYQIFDKNKVGDTAKVTLRYVRVTNGIDELGKTAAFVSYAFPNPANSIVSINYDLNEFSQQGKIVFYDMLGKVIKEEVVTGKRGTAKINVEDLNAGVYFYSLVTNGKISNTQKFVVN